MLFPKIIAELKQSPTCSVPLAGAALANMTRNTAYEAAKNGTLGVPTFWAGGKLRVPSIAVLQRLGLVEAAEDAGQKAIEAPALPAARGPRPAEQDLRQAATKIATGTKTPHFHQTGERPPLKSRSRVG